VLYYNYQKKGDTKMRTNHYETTIVTRCPFCGHANCIEVNDVDYWAWQNGALVQDAFPYLSADERELLISGICSTCWNRVFGSEEEPDPDEVDIHGNTV
jgi:hypothetical protein